jgi:hypothetical protein
VPLPSAVWQQLGQTIRGEAPGDTFGGRVAISADGTTIAAGAGLNDDAGEDAGHARVFRYNSAIEDWEQIGQDIDGSAPGDTFGTSEMKLSADGSILAVGAQGFDGFLTNAGLVRVFEYDSAANLWVQLGQDLNGDNLNIFNSFGFGIGLSADGLVVASGGAGRTTTVGNETLLTGGVIAFAYSSFSRRWEQIGQEMKSDKEEFFGRRVSMSADGRTVAGAGFDTTDPVLPGVVRVYRYSESTSSWELLGQELFANEVGDQFGSSISLSSDGNILAVGASDVGALEGQVKMYQLNTEINEWQLLGQALDGAARWDYFGWSVSLSADGSVLSVGAPRHDETGVNAGRVYVYELDVSNNLWVPRGQFVNGEDNSHQFGNSAALSADGNTLVASAPQYDLEGLSGDVRVFEYIP